MCACRCVLCVYAPLCVRYIHKIGIGWSSNLLRIWSLLCNSRVYLMKQTPCLKHTIWAFCCIFFSLPNLFDIFDGSQFIRHLIPQKMWIQRKYAKPLSNHEEYTLVIIWIQKNYHVEIMTYPRRSFGLQEIIHPIRFAPTWFKIKSSSIKLKIRFGFCSQTATLTLILN